MGSCLKAYLKRVSNCQQDRTGKQMKLRISAVRLEILPSQWGN